MRPILCSAASFLVLSLVACTGMVDGNRNQANSRANDPHASSQVELCAGPEITNSKRLVRLSSNQHVNAIGNLFGEELSQKIRVEFDIQDSSLRTFPPLANPSEGGVITSAHFRLADNIAQAVAQHVFDNFEALTGCGITPTGKCAQAYVLELAERAYRRPLTEPERSRLLTLYLDLKNAGSTVQETTEFCAYAIMNSPHFLYRREFGGDAFVDGPLDAYEMASALSFFLSDAPPDAELLAAAKAGQLATADDIGIQVTRLLAQPAVRKNLETAMLAYFDIGKLAGVDIDTEKFPMFTAELHHAMYRESQLFMADTLWSGALSEILTSRKTRVDASLAALYGITLPTSGGAADSGGFVQVELPESRAGILTQAAFLTSKARPDVPSVVARGLSLNATLLCEPPPPFPESLQDSISEANSMLSGLSEREKADYRMTTQPCAGCHVGFDPYGLALENFDILGGYRTHDEANRPIDPSVTLPDAAGGANVPDARAMAHAIAGSEAFTTCIARNMISYALAEGGADIESCATYAVSENFKKSDRSFASLIREVAIAQVFTMRSAGKKAQ